MTDHRAEACSHLQALRAQLVDELAALDAALQVLTGDAPKKKRPVTTPGEFACQQCARTFDRQQGLSMHITRTHGRLPDLDAHRAARLAAEVEASNQ